MPGSRNPGASAVAAAKPLDNREPGVPPPFRDRAPETQAVTLLNASPTELHLTGWSIVHGHGSCPCGRCAWAGSLPGSVGGVARPLYMGPGDGTEGRGTAACRATVLPPGIRARVSVEADLVF